MADLNLDIAAKFAKIYHRYANASDEDMLIDLELERRQNLLSVLHASQDKEIAPPPTHTKKAIEARSKKRIDGFRQNAHDWPDRLRDFLSKEVVVNESIEIIRTGTPQDIERLFKRMVSAKQPLSAEIADAVLERIKSRNQNQGSGKQVEGYQVKERAVIVQLVLDEGYVITKATIIAGKLMGISTSAAFKAYKQEAKEFLFPSRRASWIIKKVRDDIAFRKLIRDVPPT